jgi:hypothetical protein
MILGFWHVAIIIAALLALACAAWLLWRFAVRRPPRPDQEAAPAAGPEPPPRRTGPRPYRPTPPDPAAGPDRSAVPGPPPEAAQPPSPEAGPPACDGPIAVTASDPSNPSGPSSAHDIEVGEIDIDGLNRESVAKRRLSVAARTFFDCPAPR